MTNKVFKLAILTKSDLAYLELVRKTYSKEVVKQYIEAIIYTKAKLSYRRH